MWWLAVIWLTWLLKIVPELFRWLVVKAILPLSLLMVPKFSSVEVLICSLSLPAMVPLLIRLPLISKLRGLAPSLPVLKMIPALFTPKPWLVPIKRILPAYMPPKAEMSKATPCAVLLAVWLVCDELACLLVADNWLSLPSWIFIRFSPVITSSCLPA